MPEKTEVIEPVVDTGKWKVEMSARLEALISLQERTISLQEKTVARVEAVANAWDADHRDRLSLKAALKRGVMQTLKQIGWVE